jgi:diguanylate cyclase (GGDEF)-like protein/PAS domain S-box-containing protein
MQTAEQNATGHGEEIIAALRSPVVILDRNLRVLAVNISFCRTFGLSPETVRGLRLRDLGQAQWHDGELEKRLSEIASGSREGAEVEIDRFSPKQGRRTLSLRARVLTPTTGERTILVEIQDASEQKRLDDLFRLQKTAMDSAANAIFITDRAGIIEWANPAFERLTGFSPEEIIGKTPRLLKSGKKDKEFYRAFWQTILEGRVWTGRVTNRHKSGYLYTVEQTVTPIRDEHGKVSHFVAIHEDPSAQVESDRQIAHMAQHDFLTDLPNRFYLDDRLQLEIARSVRFGRGVSVLCLDLDNFKDINDTFGHALGDALLIAVGQRIKGNLRDVDMIARLGGDEFAVLQVNVRDKRSVAELAERLIRAFSSPFEIESQTVYVGVSIGIALCQNGRTDRNELIKQADLALYRAKKEGRNTYRFYAADMDQEIKRRMELARDLRGALERGELFLEYQPQVSIGSRRVVGVEALLRWNHPRHGIVGPTEFVPVAESCGLIEKIGAWVLGTAATQAKAWQDQGLPPFPVAVNVSAVQLRDPHFGRTVSRILWQTGLAPGYLEVELTERVLMEATETVEASLRYLDNLGVKMSLDDFGKGYASLDYLRKFPLSKLKIDRSFVHDMETNLKNATIVSAVIDLAGKLDLEVIAEGVEPANLLERLVDEGCREAQGFYFSRPIPADRFESLLRHGSNRIRPCAAA